MSSVDDVLRAFSYLALGYFVLLMVSYLAITVLSAVQVRGYFRHRSQAALRRELRSQLTPPVTICVSAYNEAATIVDSIRAMLTLQYPRYEVAVTNDGSTDATFERLVAGFELRRVDQPLRPGIVTAPVRGVYRSPRHPNLVVIDKANGGRSDGLNAAINAASSPLICCVDADSILESDGLLAAVHPFMVRPATVGAGGIIRVANGCRIESGHVTRVALPRSPLAMMQTVEYFRAFLAARTGWSAINGLLIISGAFGVFRRAAVVEVGGFATDSIGEDFELCVRLHRKARDEGRPYRLEFVPDPVCWTEVPERLRDLGGQRSRWHRGLVDTLWRHRRMIGSPRYGAVGMLSLPFFLLFEFFGALIETLGYVVVLVSLALGAINATFAITFFAVAVLCGVLLSLAAVLLEDLAFHRFGRTSDLIRLLAFSIAENFGYRQLMTGYRVRGFVSYLRGNKAWGEIQRVGFAPAPASPHPTDARHVSAGIERDPLVAEHTAHPAAHIDGQQLHRSHDSTN
jgi:cellulose synthase/poly-beta-1,6-N-acetylglucosamine synthase-like glycosyltransferase